MSLRGRQGPPKLERLESVMSQFSGSLDQDDLQDDPEELDLSGHTDLCGEPRNISFQAIYNFLPFKSLDGVIFLEEVPILVQVTEVERFTSTRVLNPNLYTIELSHGDFKWKIKRRFKHFQALHQELLKFRALLKIPLPGRIHSVKRSFKGRKLIHGEHIPALPRRPDALVKEEQLISRKLQLEDFLRNILKKPLYRTHPATVSHSSNIFPCPCPYKKALTIKCSTYRQAHWWGHSIDEFSQIFGQDFLRENRHGSFTPVRENTTSKWFVNAAGYFDAIADALEEAKEEIFITAWWLSPEIFLKRPVVDGNMWRLDHVLKRKAQEGVKIFVLLFKEVEVVMGLNSEYTKKTLMGLHPNIRVIRHPDHMPSTALLWAHHEKLVVIDQSLAFLGGIDLAYGRWDDSQHRLTDVGSVRRSPQHSPALSPSLTHQSVATVEEGEDMKFNVVVEEIQTEEGGAGKAGDSGSVEDPGEICASLILPLVEEQGENNLNLPTGRLLRTPSEKSHHSSDETESKHYSRYSLNSRTPLTRECYTKSLSLLSSDSYSLGQHHSLPLPYETSSLRSYIGSTELCGETRFWHGKDYCNFILKDWVKLNKPFDDFIDRHKTPRMPWHDIGVLVHGKAARDIARHFIQRWNFTKLVKKRSGAMCYPCLMPKSLSAPVVPAEYSGKSTQANVQLLRSVCQWSIGTKVHEESIHLAYVSAIQNSKHFIYIENQFFISCADKSIHNSIGDALTERILRAYREKKKFRVYVVMPLLPGFEGDISSGGGQAIKAIMHFNYRTMCRGEHSIIERLKCVMADCWIKYISFCGLRTHADLDGRLVTELIYVHSKLMIVDDCTIIIGSANINDRSMLGKRDSEMAVVVEDTEFQPSVMDGESYQAGRFALSLREECFRLVLGLLGDKTDISDPISDRFYKEIWMVTAAKNASVYDKVFRCLPTDAVLNYKILRDYMSRPCMAAEDPAQACAELKKIRGFLVQFPLYFLSEENLFPSFNSKEGIMPIELWT
ncbi:phospholipase D1-like [Sinocyclocheilus grahami]|uniref:phospholipase D1-like n=1 Tax=Sinocyclocheilus grahami TaxID=75366 RepID=UPI0007ACD81F|nr:PREDICTED: phospholipase D1-like [Sinocyclocheilus grahami]